MGSIFNQSLLNRVQNDRPPIALIESTVLLPQFDSREMLKIVA